MAYLGINIDHVATLRQARRECAPEPVVAARICEEAGADSIVCHIREDERHINKQDVRTLRKTVKTRLNLEMSVNPAVVRFAVSVKPDQATLVPERRQELTTEGGLDVVKYFSRIGRVVKRLQKNGIAVSLFIDPEKKQIDKSKASGAGIIEFHTGKYANAKTPLSRRRELKNLSRMTQYAKSQGLVVNAGHGLKYHNARAVAKINGIHELNIGHSIIARAVFAGLPKAVKDMRALIR